MGGGAEQIKTEAPKIETPEEKATREGQEFTGNLTKVTDAVKTPETADTIANVLDSNFQKGLKALATTPEGKAQLNTLAIDIAAQLKKTPIDAADKRTLEAIQTLITPLIMETSTTKFDKKFTTEATAGTLETYNTTKDKGLEKRTTMLTTLTDPAYKDLPGKENIIAALTTPTKTNVAALQVFLEGNINNADAKKKLIDTSKKGDIWDGKYGVNTDTALNAYLTEYTQFAAKENGTTAQKAAAEEAANAVITSTESINALNTSKATAKKKLDEAFATYKETDYTQTNWKTLTDARATGQKSIDDATTADLATNGQTTAEAIMKSIPTKTQETKTNTEKIDKTQNNLTKLQDSTAFKNLPNNIQRQVNRILNLTKRDDKVDAKIAESQKEVTDINNKIVTINTDTMNKGKELLSITNAITIMKSQNIQSQQLEQLEQQQAKLNTAMENNNAKILGLRNELVAPQARLERLQNRDERIEGRLEDKFTDIANVLQTEITKRTDVINQLDNSQVIAALTKEIETITEVKNNIKTLQDANASLAQLNNPVTPTDQTAGTEVADNNNTAVTAGADNNIAVTAGVDNNTAVTAGVDNQKLTPQQVRDEMNRVLGVHETQQFHVDQNGNLVDQNGSPAKSINDELIGI